MRTVPGPHCVFGASTTGFGVSTTGFGVSTTGFGVSATGSGTHSHEPSGFCINPSIQSTLQTNTGSGASSDVIGVESPNAEPMISISSVPAGNSMLKVLLWEEVSTSEKLGSSPSAKIIKSSSNP